MGGSSSGRHANGRELFAAQAVWPPEWRDRWSALRSAAAEEWRPPTVRAVASSPRTLKTVVQDGRNASTLRRLARRHGFDEADVARIWAAFATPDGRSTARRVEERLRLVKSVEEALASACRKAKVRIPAATRTHVRVLAVTASLRDDTSDRLLDEVLPKELPRPSR